MMQNHQLMALERDQCIGVPVIVGELNFEIIRRVNENNRADLTTNESLGRDILREGDDVEPADWKIHEGSPPPGCFPLISTTR